jgi:hypothetical protein
LELRELALLTNKYMELIGFIDPETKKNKGPQLLAKFKVKKLSELKGENLHNYIIFLEERIEQKEKEKKT